MPSNKRDPEHEQPEGFILSLRKEQLRSLWWMLKQESATEPTFTEEEISEAALPALGWRAEGKAERPVLVRGGVIADQVGYGKTIISLALVAESRKNKAPEPAPKGLIDLKATLIVVPGHLSKQWPSEIDRFTGNMFKVIVIQNMKDFNSHSTAEFSKADIIIMASEIFESEAYWSRFEYLSAQPEDWLNDKSGGRFFSDRLDAALASLRDQTARLQSDGAQAVAAHMVECQKKAKDEAQEQREAQKTAQYGKRQKGQAYRDRYDAIDGKKAKKVSAEQVQTWEASEDEEEEEVQAVPVPTYRKATGTESFSSSSVQKDSRLLSAPVMHMFR
jgi:N12 class adenine-specific DNA methylase